MPDREKVINRMETICNICKENTWRTEFSSDIVYPLLRDALALLKEQEAVEPITVGNDYRQWRCPKCCDRLRYRLDKFCPHCGRSVKWE